MSGKRPLFFVLALLAVAFALPGFYSALLVRSYTVRTGQDAPPARLALITDLHSCRYGKEECELIEAIDAQQPAAVLFSGDICDDRLPDTNVEYLLQGIASRYPCYYVTGNHEYMAGRAAFVRKISLLQRYGVRVLSGAGVVLEVDGRKLCICGIDDPDFFLLDGGKRRHLGRQKMSARFLSQLADAESFAAESGGYRILLSHRPEYAPEYASRGFDLVLCGHAHGGQWRIPFLLNGFFAPNQGFFPRYAGGRYDFGNTTVIVSRGLARESTPLFRFYNRPELVIITLE